MTEAMLSTCVTYYARAVACQIASAMQGVNACQLALSNGEQIKQLVMIWQYVQAASQSNGQVEHLCGVLMSNHPQALQAWYTEI